MNAAAILESLLVVDQSKLAPDIAAGLANGQLTLSTSNGNAYWAAGSGRTGIAAHLPMRPLTPEERAGIEQLLKLGQSTGSARAAALLATGLSTVVIAAVVIAATAVIVSRINNVSAQVADVADALHQQDLREYLHVQTDLEALCKRSSELLKPGRVPGEVKDQAQMCLNRLAVQREKQLIFVRKMCAALDQQVDANDEQGAATAPDPQVNAKEQRYAMALDFMIATLDWVPVSLATERELCLLADKPVMAQALRDHGAAEFRSSLQEFLAWCEAQYARIALGKPAFVDTMVQRRQQLDDLANSSVHDLLLGDRTRMFAEETLRRQNRSRAGAAEAAETSQTSAEATHAH